MVKVIWHKAASHWRDRRDRQDRQWSDGIWRTVFQTIAQKQQKTQNNDTKWNKTRQWETAWEIQVTRMTLLLGDKITNSWFRCRRPSATVEIRRRRSVNSWPDVKINVWRGAISANAHVIWLRQPNTRNGCVIPPSVTVTGDRRRLVSLGPRQHRADAEDGTLKCWKGKLRDWKMRDQKT